MDDLLKTARDNLQIQQVFLSDCAVRTSEKFSPSNFDFSIYEVQNFNNLNAIQNITVEELAEPKTTSYFYEYFVETGVRLVPKGSDIYVDDEDVLVEIAATFRCVYYSQVELSEECLMRFGENNVFFHARPYWREYIHSTCARIGVNPAITIPQFVMNSGK